MKKKRMRLMVFILLLASVLMITACEETASRFTDRTIENLEDEVGGAAERSRDRSADQAGGAICGSNVALILLFTGVPAVIAMRRPGSIVKVQGKKNSRHHGIKKAIAERRQ